MSQPTLPKETFWSRFASDFEKRNNYVAGLKEINSLKNLLSENKKLGKTLELGCGDGVYTNNLVVNSEKVIATDWSIEMVEASRLRFKDNTDIEVKQENCLSLSFENNSFDTVFMANLLHVIPTPEKALDECKRVLKNDGTLILISFTAFGMTFLNKLGMLYRYIRTYGKPPKESTVLTTSNVNEMLNNAGFDVVRNDLLGDKMKSIYAIGKSL